jgi:hypothetical protein
VKPVWQRPPQVEMLIVAREDRMLQVFVARVSAVKWMVYALEVPPPSASEAVFDAHAHAVIGKRPAPTRAAARARGERYARSWLRQRVLVAPCACEEVDTAGAGGGA